ncbi:MAG: tRNA (adenosine(37)-N6)-dimethylallyltransferase MiaA [Alphaproteobacteria bacterium]|nr:MAG: tRNA (adenosine(37)-N6)-dimethylallyltransferase MiaA [Alphaproteobacteria bacterium]
MNPKRAILIAGPTASGKSEVALQVAKKIGGVIINADSMQVYEGLDILTAKPGAGVRAMVPHHLYGVKKADEAFSVADWLVLASAAAECAWTARKTPIFVGGTGLYFKALLDGLVEIPKVPKEIRRHLRRKMETEGVAALYQTLKEKDPVTADRLDANDRQRILRALEVYEATGKPLSAWQQAAQKGFLNGAEVLKICLEVDREDLEKKIRARFQGMVSKGAPEEVKTLAARNLSPDLPIMKAIGVRPLLRHLNEEITLEETIELVVIESRQYAKRQRTWFKGQFTGWTFLPAGVGVAREILSLAKKTFRD